MSIPFFAHPNVGVPRPPKAVRWNEGLATYFIEQERPTHADGHLI
ncbi:MAG: hypothetical protein Q7J76_11305 [Candidatus Brocadiaceae bacterium]|nr:hypothetical protein [Candidatus Brocadiaceae bacterium]